MTTTKARDVPKLVGLPDILTGGPWPQTSETAMFALADHFWWAGRTLADLIHELDSVMATVECVMSGESFNAFQALAFQFRQRLVRLSRECDWLGSLCNAVGVATQRVKCLINLVLALSAMYLCTWLALAWTGVCSLAVFGVAANARQFCWLLITRFIHEIGMLGIGHFAKHAAIGAGLTTAMDTTVQANQYFFGRRRQWDVAGQLEMARSGALGSLFGAIPSPLKGILSRILWNGFTSGTVEFVDGLVSNAPRKGTLFAAGMFSGLLTGPAGISRSASELPDHLAVSHEPPAPRTSPAPHHPPALGKSPRTSESHPATAVGHVAEQPGQPNPFSIERIQDSILGVRDPYGQLDSDGLKRLSGALPHLPALDEATRTGGFDPTSNAAMRSTPDSQKQAALREYSAASAELPVGTVELRQVSGSGASGAPVFYVRDSHLREVAGITKVFPRFDGFARELSALHRLGNAEFTAFQVPQVLGAAVANGEKGNIGILTTTVASGRPFPELVQSVSDVSPASRPDRFVVLREGTGLAAEALAQLNVLPEGSGRPVSPHYGTWYFQESRRFISHFQDNSFLAENPVLRLDLLRARFDESIEHMKHHPGEFASIIHADANLGNFFLDNKKRITFIDVEKTHYSLDQAGRPIGPPAHQMAVFWSSLHEHGWDLGLMKPEIAALWKHFDQSYRTANGAPYSAEAFRFYAGHSLLYLLKNSLPQGGSLVPAQKVEAKCLMLIDLLREMGYQ